MRGCLFTFPAIRNEGENARRIKWIGTASSDIHFPAKARVRAGAKWYVAPPTLYPGERGKSKGTSAGLINMFIYVSGSRKKRCCSSGVYVCSKVHQRKYPIITQE